MASLVRYLPPRLKRVLKEKLVQVELSRPYEIIVNPDHRPLAGKLAVVTGASGAIGRAISVRLASDGAKVVAVARDTDKLVKLAAEINALGGLVSSESLDITDAAAVFDLATRLDPIDILVNNAGGSSRSRHAHIWDQSVDVIDDVIAVNLRATMVTVAAFGKKMVDHRRGGCIVNIGSTVGVGGLSRFSEYAASKAGVAGFTRSAALEFGAHDITVNCVTPGIVQRGRISQAQAERITRKQVLSRIGRAEDIAEMVAFVAGPRATWITGQEFVVDGGRSLGLHGEP